MTGRGAWRSPQGRILPPFDLERIGTAGVEFIDILHFEVASGGRVQLSYQPDDDSDERDERSLWLYRNFQDFRASRTTPGSRRP
ncbi:MAG TPA: hypothetical protein VEM93_07675 [Actinomycetota bacterium]|nr:hypothetical protein [Actinomycetota bacterium]